MAEPRPCYHFGSVAPSITQDEEGRWWAWCMACGKQVFDPTERQLARSTD